MPMKKGGKVSKGMKKFPRISDYLEVHHPTVYQLLVDSGMIANLTPKRGTGRTFLVPDSKLVKEIRKLLDSSDEGPEKASEILGSLIIKDYLPTVKEWLAKKDDLPNVMGKKVQVKSGSGTTVELVAGKAELDKKYTPFKRQGLAPRGNTAVWKLTGHIPHDDKVPAATGKYIRKGAPTKGAFEFTGDEKINLKQLTERIANDFDQGKEQVFESALAGLLDHCSDDKLCKVWICMNLSHGPAAAYFNVFQPGCESPGYRLLNDQVMKFLRSDFQSTAPNPSKRLLEECNMIKDNKAAMEARYAKLDEALESGNAVAVLQSAYKDLGERNTINNVSGVLPDVLADRLKEMADNDNVNRAKFLAGADEFGFCAYKDMAESPDKGDVTRALLEKCSRKYNEPVLTDEELMRSMLKPKQLYLGTMALARSSSGLNIPMSPDAIKSMGEYDSSSEHPYSGGDINRSSAVIGAMEEAASTHGGNDAICLPEGLSATIKNYARMLGYTAETKLGDIISGL